MQRPGGGQAHQTRFLQWREPAASSHPPAGTAPGGGGGRPAATAAAATTATAAADPAAVHRPRAQPQYFSHGTAARRQRQRSYVQGPAWKHGS